MEENIIIYYEDNESRPMPDPFKRVDLTPYAEDRRFKGNLTIIRKALRNKHRGPKNSKKSSHSKIVANSYLTHIRKLPSIKIEGLKSFLKKFLAKENLDQCLNNYFGGAEEDLSAPSDVDHELTTERKKLDAIYSGESSSNEGPVFELRVPEQLSEVESVTFDDGEVVIIDRDKEISDDVKGILRDLKMLHDQQKITEEMFALLQNLQ